MKYLTMSPKKLTLLFIFFVGFISAQEVTIIDALTSEFIAGASLYNQTKDRNTINQWLMAQMGTIGPMLGQHHQFHHYNPGKSQFGEERFFKIAKRLYGELDERLSSSKYLAGDDYTIADIATWPWIARHEWHDIGLKNYKNLSSWYIDISKREAVIKGYQFMNKKEFPPQP